LSNELRSKFYGKFVGRTLHALVEYAGQSKDEWGKGLTGNYISVQIKGLDKTHEGKVVPVKIDAVRNNEAYGLLTFE
jgi:tRNA A37 methylthiotransferase MiaB